MTGTREADGYRLLVASWWRSVGQILDARHGVDRIVTQNRNVDREALRQAEERISIAIERLWEVADDIRNVNPEFRPRRPTDRLTPDRP